MAKQLTDTEIKHRLIKLRNYEHNLYPAARTRIAKLEGEVKSMKAANAELQTIIADQSALLQKLKLQIEQLNAKVFGRGRRGKNGSNDPDSILPPPPPKESKTPRDASSYRRAVPSEDEITDRQHHVADVSDHAGHNLTNQKTIDFYEEDIVLPSQVSLKTITRHRVESVYCQDCNVWIQGKDIPKQKVILGGNLPRLVSFLSVVSRFSYQQIQDHLDTFYRIKVSDGQIGDMLTAQAGKLRPAYESLIESILKQSGVHFDESTWKILIEKLGHYVWVMSGTDNRDAAFFFGQSRGKDVLTKKMLAPLKASGKRIIGISDDYGSYRSVAEFLAHALCWAHPNRKLRDLAQSKTLDKLTKARCILAYQQFNALYQEVNVLWQADVSKADRNKQRKRLTARFKAIARSNSKDSPELATLKTSLRSNQAAYFVCLKYPNIPPDNNKAERALRHVVLKRKACFGSKTQKGADVLSVLYSVLLSLHWRQPQDFFSEYDRLLQMSA